MKRFIYSSLLLLISYSAANAQVAWKQKADFPGDGRSSASSFSFSDYGYIGLGYDGENFRRSFYAYDPAADTWVQVESLGGAAGDGLERNVAPSFIVGNIGYVGTGQNGDPFLKDFWAYNYTTNVWTLKSDFGGTDRRCSIGFSASGKGYIGLGQDASGFKNDLWEYDTTAGTWTQKADFIGTPRRLAVCFVIDDKAYVGTGDDGGFKNDFYQYNPGTNTWYIKNDFDGSPRYGAIGFAVNGKGYLACGYDTTLANRSDFWEYNPSIDAWTAMPDFPGGARANMSAFVCDTMAYVGMGYDDTSYRYDIWLWGDTTTIKPQDTTDTNVAIINIEKPLLDISIFPNPVKEATTINIAMGIYDENAEIKIYDLNGNDVTENCSLKRMSNSSNIQSWQLTNHGLPPGTYLVNFISKQGRGTSRFIVM